MEADMGQSQASSSSALVHTSATSHRQQPLDQTSHRQLPVDQTSHRQQLVDQSFSGVSTNVKLLLRLIQEYKEASMKGHREGRDQRISEMMLIIDDVKTQIQKSQSLGRRREAELRRCNTDVRRTAPREKKSHEPITDEKEKLRRELNASLAARKSLESICSSIGREKEIIAKELARTVQQLHGMEEHVNDLKAQNEMLLSKVQVCVAEHKVKKSSVPADTQSNIDALQKRNKALSEQLLKALEAYRSLKRKLKDYRERNNGVCATMEEMGLEVRVGRDKINSFREMITEKNEENQDDIEQEISALEHMFECFDSKISKHIKTKRHSRVGSKHGQINADKSLVLA